MNERNLQRYWKPLLGLWAGYLGFVGPYMISAANNEMVFMGAAIGAGILWFTFNTLSSKPTATKETENESK